MEKEPNRQVVRFEEQVKTGSSALDGSLCFVDFAERYMKDYGCLSLKPTTLSNYERNLVRINQAIGHIRLKDLTPLHIQTFYRNLQEEGVRQPGSQGAVHRQRGHHAPGPGHDPLIPPHHFLHSGEGRQVEVHPQQSGGADGTALPGRAQGPILRRAGRQADVAAAPGRADQVAGTHHFRLALRSAPGGAAGPPLAGRQPGRRRPAYRPDLQLCVRQGRVCQHPQTEDSDRYLRVSRTAVLSLLKYKR